LVNKYHTTSDAISQNTKAQLHGKACFACYKKFQPGKLRICFPESALLENQQHEFETLSKVQIYSLANSMDNITIK